VGILAWVLAEKMQSAELTRTITRLFAVVLRDGPVTHSTSVVVKRQRISAHQTLVEQTLFATLAMTEVEATDLCALVHPVTLETPCSVVDEESVLRILNVQEIGSATILTASTLVSERVVPMQDARPETMEQFAVAHQATGVIPSTNALTTL